jgi:phenylacetate-CoA ligase
VSRLDPSETWTERDRRDAQRARLGSMAAEVLATNAFYRRKLGDAGIRSGADLAERWNEIPFTTKAEVSGDQADHPPYGTNLTYPLERYVRLHQTSGTTGRPLRVLDTAESWNWWGGLWAFIYAAAGVTLADRAFFAFSFGPFIGFWSAFAGAERLGALCVSGAAQTTAERLASIVATRATVLLCTPTYALRLAEAARDEGVDLAASDLRVAVLAGEPGASIPSTRERIEKGLGVTVFDHTGASEVGATGFSCDARDGVHLIEREFVAEVRDPRSGEVAEDGEGELVLTNLGRWGWPVIRYRTGDLVRARRERCACGRTWLKLVGGIIGRTDDMVIVRGVNVYPAAIESVVRAVAGIAEYRVEAYEERGMTELRLVVEPEPGAIDGIGERVADALHRALGIRCAVTLAAPGSLPRSEMKGRRFVRV